MIAFTRRKLILWLLSAIALAVALYVVRRCIYLEPAFIVKGNAEIASKAHVNVYMMRTEAPSFMATVFLNGTPYTADNSDVDRYFIYISYDNQLYTYYEYDNVPRMVNDDRLARNTFYLCKKTTGIYLSTDRDLKCDGTKNWKLLPFDEEVQRVLAEQRTHYGLKAEEEGKFVQGLREGFDEVHVSK